jgi:hypothetical protein
MVIVVTVRRVILFPAIAIEAPGAGSTDTILLEHVHAGALAASDFIF